MVAVEAADGATDNDDADDVDPGTNGFDVGTNSDAVDEMDDFAGSQSFDIKTTGGCVQHSTHAR